jgi:hypothetical protein
VKLRLVAVAVVVLGLVVAGGWYRGASTVAGAMRVVGGQGEDASPDAATALKAAGVHKCLGAHRTSYSDGPCPAGTREAAASGGAVMVMSFPKPSPIPSPLASAVSGGPILKPMDPDERDRLRDKAIDDAANRR